VSAATNDGAAEAGAAEGDDATLPLPRLLRVGRPALVGGAVRGLLVAPWFAAAAGFVVAVGVWISAPHAEFRFPSAVGEVPCQVTGCGNQAGQGAGQPTTTKGQPIAHHKKAANSDAGRRTAASGLTFGYVVLWHQQGKFAVLITVRGTKALRSWDLAFRMPGDQITYVSGAAWQPSGTDGGTASVQADQHKPREHGDADGPDPSGHVISFTVYGQGTPVAPTGCTFDKATCSFS
jgi:hypothetical protein